MLTICQQLLLVMNVSCFEQESELKLPTPIDYVKPDAENTVTSINEDQIE